MINLKKIVILVFIWLFFAQNSFCATAWINDLRSLFLSNNAIIYGINIRSFNANDRNNNGIIEENLGETKGSFLNAIDRLDEISSLGINTIDLLPVTPVGKTKALGTAGSLFAITSFNKINPQLKDSNSTLTVKEEMRKFITECHNRKIRVIVDLPCCAAYDLYLTNPTLFKLDMNQNPVIPADWTDVRLLNAGSEKQINPDVYNLYKDFINLMISLDVDGIRASGASMKPFIFWKNLIDETRRSNPQFLFLADASPLEKEAISGCTTFTPYNKLLEAGFDGYYGGYSELKNWKDLSDLFNKIKSDIEMSEKYSGQKRVMGDFATHDQLSPILVNGEQFSKMILWLSSTLPMNSYYLDGFATGDTYLYPLINKKADKTFTDDEYYFVHRGQLDIFNFSRKPVGKNGDIYQEFIIANKFKMLAKNILNNGNFVKLKTSCPNVFSYARSFNSSSVIVIGNLDFKKDQNVIVNVAKINNNLPSIPIKINNVPTILNGKIQTKLTAGEIQVLLFNSLDLK